MIKPEEFTIRGRNYVSKMANDTTFIATGMTFLRKRFAIDLSTGNPFVLPCAYTCSGRDGMERAGDDVVTDNPHDGGRRTPPLHRQPPQFKPPRNQGIDGHHEVSRSRNNDPIAAGFVAVVSFGTSPKIPSTATATEIAVEERGAISGGSHCLQRRSASLLMLSRGRRASVIILILAIAVVLVITAFTEIWNIFIAPFELGRKSTSITTSVFFELQFSPMFHTSNKGF